MSNTEQPKTPAVASKGKAYGHTVDVSVPVSVAIATDATGIARKCERLYASGDASLEVEDVRQAHSLAHHARVEATDDAKRGIRQNLSMITNSPRTVADWARYKLTMNKLLRSR